MAWNTLVKWIKRINIDLKILMMSSFDMQIFPATTGTLKKNVLVLLHSQHEKRNLSESNGGVKLA